jgi:hypothetical protein
VIRLTRWTKTCAPRSFRQPSTDEYWVLASALYSKDENLSQPRNKVEEVIVGVISVQICMHTSIFRNAGLQGLPVLLSLIHCQLRDILSDLGFTFHKFAVDDFQIRGVHKGTEESCSSSERASSMTNLPSPVYATSFLPRFLQYNITFTISIDSRISVTYSLNLRV